MDDAGLEHLRHLGAAISRDSAFARTLLASSGPTKREVLADIFLTLSDIQYAAALSGAEGISLGCSSVLVVLIPTLLLFLALPIYLSVGSRLPEPTKTAIEALIAYGFAGILLGITANLISRLPKLVTSEKSLSTPWVGFMQITGLWKARVAMGRWRLAQLTAIWQVPNMLYLASAVPSDVQSCLQAEIADAMDGAQISCPRPDVQPRIARVTHYAIIVYLILGIGLLMTLPSMIRK